MIASSRRFVSQVERTCRERQRTASFDEFIGWKGFVYLVSEIFHLCEPLIAKEIEMFSRCGRTVRIAEDDASGVHNLRC